MSTVVLSLGANLGDRARHLRDAVAGLGDTVRAVSGLYQTPPWGDSDQPAYLNAVLIAADQRAGPADWLRRAHVLEQAAGRRRDPARRYGPRTLDVDIIAAYRDTLPAGTADVDALLEPIVSDSQDLTLPHPRAAQRAFVLVPLQQLSPGLVLPGAGRLDRLLAEETVAADADGVCRVGAADWWQAGDDD